MTLRYALGLDVGTSSVKATLISEDGAVRTARSTPYATAVPAPDWCEQDPEHWWDAVGEVLEEISQAVPELTGQDLIVGLTGQMHTSVLRDAAGELLRPAILWSDARSSAQAEKLNGLVPDAAERTGNTVIPAFTVCHLAWVRDNEPTTYAQISSIAVPKDDIRCRLGAGYATEPSDASATGLMDTHTDCWSAPMLDAIGMDASVLPDIVPSHEVTGTVRNLPARCVHARRLLGARVIAGAGDQAAQAVALDVTAPETLGFSIGTSGVAFQSSAEAQAGAFRHAYPDRWLSLDSTHAAGLALSWWSQVSSTPIQDFSEDEPTGREPIFLPYLQGHRSASGAPGALVGLDMTHDAAAIGRAIMEGVAFELVRLARSVGSGAIAVGPAHLGGGGGRSRLWRQVLANALEREVIFTDRDSSFGAAALAAEAAGWREFFHGADNVRSERAVPQAGQAALTASRLLEFSETAQRLSVHAGAVPIAS